MPRVRIVAVAIIVGLSVAAGGGIAARAAATEPVPTVVVPAPGGAPWNAARVRALDDDLDALIAHAATLRGAHVGIVVQTTAGQVLYAHNADDTVQPASTFKLLAGSAALDRLGPAYRFTTALQRVPAGPPGRDALVLRGGGDPLLGAADLEAAAAAAQAAGVAGPVDLTIDTSHIAPGERRGEGWQVDDMLQDYAMIVNGLPFEENVLAAWLDPAATIGDPPAIRLTPPFRPLAVPSGTCPGGPTALTFTNRARTVAAGAEATADVEPGRCGDIVVTGDAPQGGPTSLAIAVDAPELLAYGDFVSALAGHGIDVAPPAPSGDPLPGISDQPITAGGPVIWRHQGEPLAALLADMWLPSDNLIAEQLFHELDAAATGRPATAAGAAGIERAWLTGIGVDPAALTIADGSGLSQYDRITPRILTTILAHDWSGPNRAVVLAALPVAGVRGDLRRFALGTPAAGRVFAKTGSMMHVRGLAGYLATRSHGAVIFALSVDDWMGTDADMARFRAAVCTRIVTE
jgi:D-alanyl-D-alanine carboxypeptidase/D-alanyl-D-alanine-endopeptidase (penicillin-binding protein 4)